MAVQLGYTNIFRYPTGYPEWKKMDLPVEADSAAAEETDAGPETPAPLGGWAFLWTLLGVFAGGAALNLTPCVYPLIPITVSYFGGRGDKSKATLIGHGVCYIGGLAATNSALGVAAAMTGGLMGAMLQSPATLFTVAAVLLLFAASLFGLWEIRLPTGLTRVASKTYTGYLGSLFMGVTMGVVAAPCIGPFVLGLLTWVASTGNPWLGFLVFFTLSIGLGLPLFFLAMFSGQLEKLPRSGEWMLWVKKVMGWVLVGMAAYFIRPVLMGKSGVFLLAGVALAAGLHLGWIDKTRAGFRLFRGLKIGVGLIGLVLGAYLIGSTLIQAPGVTWSPWSEQLIMESRQQKKPVIIDFYATWCAPCRELDEITFHDPGVVEKIGRDFVMIKVDLTRDDNPAHARLLKEYEVKGVPTIVFLDRNGKERRDLRLITFLPADQFLIRMNEALKK